MNHIQVFAKLLRIKSLLQRINQLSWSIQKFHYKYKSPENMSEKEHSDLVEGYRQFYEEVKSIYEQLTNEYESK